MKTVWRVAAAIWVLAFFFLFLERPVELRTELKTGFGIEESKKESDGERREVVVGKEDTIENDA